MKRGGIQFVVIQGPKHWGPIRSKKDMHRVQQKREDAQQSGKPSASPPLASSLQGMEEAVAGLTRPRRSEERYAMLRLMAQRRREAAAEEFRASVASLLQHRTPPLYPDSFHFFEDVKSDVLTPFTPPPYPTPRTPPAGYIVHLERRILELFGFAFRHKALMVQAFTHPSFFGVGEADSAAAKRASLLPLTYVGHALLHLHMRSYLMQVWPNRSFEEYQLFVGHWLASDTVCALSEALQLPQLALTDADHAHQDSFLVQQGTPGFEVKKTGARIGCEVLEAFVGAIYLDSDIAKVTDFLQKHAIPYFTRSTPLTVFQAVRAIWDLHPTSIPTSAPTMNLPKDDNTSTATPESDESPITNPEPRMREDSLFDTPPAGSKPDDSPG